MWSQTKLRLQGSLELAQNGIANLRMQKSVRLHLGNSADWKLPRKPDLVVTNPPWGVRLLGRAQSVRGAADSVPEPDDMSNQELDDTWSDLRMFLKSQCAGPFARCSLKRCS